MPDQRIRRDAKIVGRKLLCSPLPFARQRLWPVAGAEQKIFSDRELAHQRVVLINNGQTKRPRQQRVGAGERFAHDRDAAFIGGDGASGNPEQRTLARAIFSKDCVNFAGAAFEIDAVKRLHAGIALGYARQLERGTGFISHQESNVSFVAATKKREAYVPLKSRGRTGVAQSSRSSDPVTVQDAYCFANISFIISLSTSVVSDALSGIAGLHWPLTTGCILNGTLMVGGTSLPSFFIIAAVRAKRA